MSGIRGSYCSPYLFFHILPKLTIGTSKGFIRGKALSTEGHTHSGYANVNHTHSINDVTTGVLPISLGGTGVTTVEELRTLMGAQPQLVLTQTLSFMLQESMSSTSVALGKACAYIEILSTPDRGALVPLPFMLAKGCSPVEIVSIATGYNKRINHAYSLSADGLTVYCYAYKDNPYDTNSSGSTLIINGYA